MLGTGNNFLEAHGRNVYIGQMNTHVGVSFVGTHHKTTRFGNGEVDTREGYFTGQECIAQVLSGGFGQVLRIGSSFVGAQVFVKRIAQHPLLSGEWQAAQCGRVGSPRNCTIRSPRSLSITSMPCRVR